MVHSCTTLEIEAELTQNATIVGFSTVCKPIVLGCTNIYLPAYLPILHSHPSQQKQLWVAYLEYELKIFF